MINRFSQSIDTVRDKMIVALVLFAVICFLAWKWMFYRPPNFPPGPPRLPLLGSYPFLCLISTKHLHKAAMVLGKFYKTNVLGLYLGSCPTVVALDHKSVKTILTDPFYDGRPDTFVARMRDPERQLRGIFFTANDFWKDQRRFFLRHLRDFGFGRRFNELEDVLGEELQDFVEMIRKGPKYSFENRFMTSTGRICAPDIFFAFFSNSFLRIATGKSIPGEEQESLLNLGLSAMRFHGQTETYGRLLVIIPWIRHFLPNWCGFKTIEDSCDYFYNFVEKIVDRELNAFQHDCEDGMNGGAQGNSFIYMYAEQMHIAQRDLIANPAYHCEQLKMALMDFLFAALTTLPTQTSFLILHLLKNPSCLARMQSELDEVVGRGRLPTLDDRVNLPYTEACIREILRLETIATTALAHVTLKDAKLEGYDVPADSFAFATLYAFHRDKEFWGPDADNFNPARFLDEKGKLNISLDQSLPFGAGHRLCAGETFGRNTLFLMVTALFQNFNLDVQGTEKSVLEKEISGLIRHVPPFWVQLRVR